MGLGIALSILCDGIHGMIAAVVPPAIESGNTVKQGYISGKGGEGITVYSPLVFLIQGSRTPDMN
jgi:hypothetical protein